MPIQALETGLYNILSGNAALTTALGGTLIYNKQAPQEPGTKYVVFNWAGGGDENLTPHRTRNVVYTVQAVADTQGTAAALDRLIDAALHEQQLWPSGYTNFWTAREDDVNFAEIDAGGNPIYHAGAQYRVRIDDDTTYYNEKVLNTAPDNLIGYWPLTETAGTIIYNATGAGSARDGTYTDVTLNSATGPDSQPAPAWDGTASFARVNSAGFLSAFNVSKGSLAVQLKPNDATMWDGATIRRVCHFAINSNNVIYIQKGAANRLDFGYSGGGVGSPVLSSNITTADWQHAVLTWSVDDDEVKGYLDGVLQDTAQGLGTFAGAITQATIGSNESAPGLVWNGNIQHVAVWNTPLTAAQALELSRT